jgi:hypothetical protein
MRKRLKETIYSYIETFDDDNLDSVDIVTGILSFKEFKEFDAEDVMICLHELVDEGKIVREGWYKIVR